MATFQHTSADSRPQPGPSRVLAEALRWAEHEPLISSLDQHGHARELWRVVLLKYCLGVAFDKALAHRLVSSPALRQLCGFGRWIPTDELIGTFQDGLVDHQSLIDDAVIQAVSRLATRIDHRSFEWRCPAGSVLSVSSSHIAEGVVAHALVDGCYGYPLSMVLTPDEQNDDGSILPVLIEKVRSEHPWIEIVYLLGGRAYDHPDVIRYLRNQEIMPVIPAHPRHRQGETADWYFSRAKRFFLLDQPDRTGLDAIKIHVATSVLAYVSTVISRVSLQRVKRA